MMAQRRLQELLLDDQEPFHLKNYIADRRCLLKKPSPRTQLQVRKRKPVSQNSSFPSNFCKNACFFSFHDSPDPKMSPLFEFPSPAKSPCKSPNAIFLHIPARTASLLLEAAVRIQKQSSKAKPQNKNNGLGLFGSILKRLTNRNKARKREIAGDGVEVSVKDILRWDSSVGRRKSNSEKYDQKKRRPASPLNDKTASNATTSSCEPNFSCSCNGRPSSAVWSESNEEMSLDLDLDTSSSGQSEDFEEVLNDTAFGSPEKHFCESPFHFVLQRSPSSGHRTPIFSSPATSPSHNQKEDKENYDVENLKKLQATEEEEEEKEQCSPVSVLDPPFEDDEDGHVDDDMEEDHFDLDCSYAIVQRAKQKLLHKLRRFEKLAELDPVELEQRMLEQEDNDDESGTYTQAEEDEFEYSESTSSDGDMNIDGLVQEVLGSSLYQLRCTPEGMKKLVSDLITEETQHNCCLERDVIAKRVCKRLESWKEVESNTIDMMVEQDFRRELEEWKKNQDQVGEAAVEIEFAIFGLLVEEVSEELVCLTGF